MSKIIGKQQSAYRCILMGVLIIVLAGLLAACGGGGSLQAGETQVYENPAGYHVSLPADWQVESETAESTIFLSADGATSFTLYNELGGEAYYTLTEIADMVRQNLPAGDNLTVDRNLVDNKKELRQVIKGQDESGKSLVLDLYIAQPYAGIRFYLLFAGGAGDYSNQNGLYSDIIKSFTVDENQEYLYDVMQKRRDEAATETADEEEAQPDVMPEIAPDAEPEE